MDRRFWYKGIVAYLLVVLLVCCSIATAQTYVSGPVSGTWTPAGSPYVVTDTLEVLAGQTLEIQPGVDVQFDGPYALLVHGTLNAGGAPNDSISFAPRNVGSHWGGISFLAVGEGSSLEYCSFVDASKEAWPPDSAAGGAIFSQDSSPIISHCRFERCTVEDGGGLPGGGGAIWCVGGSPQVIASSFVDCSANVFCTSGGGAIGFHQTDIVIRDNEILNCSAHGMGGGIGGTASAVDISSNVIAECSGFHYGGGIGLRDGCTGILFNNLVIGNEVPDLAGGGVYLRDSYVDVICCTIANNSVGDGGYGYGGGLYVEGTTTMDVLSSIIWNNSGFEGAQIYPTNLLYVGYCDVEGGYWGGSNFDLDPLFISDPQGSQPDGYFLSCLAAGQGADSPCIDAGSFLVTHYPELAERTTRTDQVTDTDVVDLGFHHAIVPLTGVDDTPRSLTLAQNQPNPFNPTTTISFDLPEPARISLRIYDLSGRLVRTLVAGQMIEPGLSHADWHGRDDNDRPMAAGVYFYRLEAGGLSETKRMTMVK